MSNIATIRLCNLIFYGYHGVLAEEKSLGQRFEIDLEYQFDCDLATTTDQLHNSISYADIYEFIEHAVSHNQFKLLETLANFIMTNIREKYPILSICVKIRKPSVPIPGVLDHVEVELSWNSKDNGS
ncbi:MAG: dihydroneopterin aldolase [SAR324 cluster bacterium]|nr:dihydroneopterin aldolase [SAR324 cluster bacterium]